MQTEDFKYYIADKSNRTYSVNPDGSIVATSLMKELPFSPDGWLDQAINYIRSTAFPGVYRSFTIPMRFSGDACAIIRYLFYTFGLQAYGRLIITKLDTDTEIYEPYYSGTLDFSEVDDGDAFIELSVLEGGLVELITANRGTTYEIDVDSAAVSVKCDGIRLTGYREYLVGNGTTTLDYFRNHIVDLFSIGNEGSSYVFGTKDQQRTKIDITDNTAIKNTLSWFIESDSDQDVEIDYDYSVLVSFANGSITITPGISFVVNIRVLKDDTVISNNLLYSATGVTAVYGSSPTTGKRHDIAGPYTLHIPAGCKGYLISYVTVQGSTGDSLTSFDYSVRTDGSFKVNYTSRFKETNVNMVYASYVFDQLIKKITNSDPAYSTRSNLLNSDAEYFMLTCGDAVRGLAGAKIKTSLDDFLSNYQTRFGAALGIEGTTAICEARKYFFNDSQISDVGEVSNYHTSIAKDHVFNTFAVGYQEQSYDDANGKDEFNNTSRYTSPITKITKELSLVSPYRADCYGFEYTRINLDGKTTTDNSSDNDIWMVNVLETIINTGDETIHFFTLNRPTYDSLTGSLNPDTIFNVECTPSRCFAANGDYVHIGLDKLDSEYLTFQVTDKNSALKTVKGATVFQENANIKILSLTNKLFLPVLIQFDCSPDANIKQMIEQNPYGLIRGTWKGISFTGFISECSQQPSTDQKQTYTLLADTGNDFTKFIFA